ncbi:hypothetical protein D3C76_1547790 [compost metagenome]
MQRQPPIPLAAGITGPHVMTAIRPVMMALFSYVIPPVNNLCGETFYLKMSVKTMKTLRLFS